MMWTMTAVECTAKYVTMCVLCTQVPKLLYTETNLMLPAAWNHVQDRVGQLQLACTNGDVKTLVRILSRTDTTADDVNGGVMHHTETRGWRCCTVPS